LLVPLALCAAAATAWADGDENGTLVNLADGAGSPFVVNWGGFPVDLLFQANLLNNVGDVVCLVGVETASDQQFHELWFRWSDGKVTIPWGMDAFSGFTQGHGVTIASGKQAGMQYFLNTGFQSGLGDASIFGLDDSGAIYASGNLFDAAGNFVCANFRVSRDGRTVTPLPADLNSAPYASQVTMDGRTIVNMSFSAPMEIYTWNDKKGAYDGPFTAALPNGTFFPFFGTLQVDLDGTSNPPLPRLVNNSLEVLVSGTDSSGQFPQSYVYQVGIKDGVVSFELEGTPGPGYVGTVISERGWIAGWAGDQSSNFIYRPDSNDLELLAPPADQGISYFALLPFAINRAGTIGLTSVAFTPTGLSHITLSRAPDGTYTSMGLGLGTLFPSSFGTPLYGNVLGFAMNEQGEIGGTNSWVATDTTFGVGFAAWLWTPKDQSH
jgi:hypothetical protein